MPWIALRSRRRVATLSTPPSELDPAVDILELGPDGRFISPSPRSREESSGELPYDAGARDAGSLAGIWEAFSRS